MNVEIFRDYCLAKKGVTEEFPFDENTLVFKVMGKMFALTGLNRIPFSVNLKCNPDRAIELREYHPEITPGYHMSKTHWNTIDFTGGLPTDLLFELIDHSYDLVVNSLTKKLKQELENL
ncbi:MmcQ/YjbR family DNA-binding protein [Aquimarina sp. MMG016]|uniref:MmcQ/YjbR family DNA-binding protein n=1 Tax=Aquimarina sp. MMG016 TaxID=2822690 RepID=UPI001B39EE25|nr:MmcQ/YjbR family DNA-binding protein [Aquimarina sp. MMG016]MBQ4820900.1 MmcQ/YjbR family DNA-binding protein [Aquimarina sp. MMG016]